MNKRSELDILTCNVKPKIICLTEILPKNHVNIDIFTEFSIDGYDLFFNDPFHRGVAIYVDETLDAQKFVPNNLVDESVWCMINLCWSNFPDR